MKAKHWQLLWGNLEQVVQNRLKSLKISDIGLEIILLQTPMTTIFMKQLRYGFSEVSISDISFEIIFYNYRK